MVILKRALISFLCLGISINYAAIPKFSIIPIPPLPPSVLYITNTATANYRITNNTYITRTLTMVPITGVTQVGGTCTAPAFTLAHGASCVLSLLITANQLSASGIGCRTEGDLTLCSPEICKVLSAGNPSPDPFLCSQPSSANSLRVRATTMASITSDISALALSTTGTGGIPRIIRITNNSASTVTNITYNASPALPAGTTVVPTNCAIVVPGGVCTLTITPSNNPTTTPVTLSVSGNGTNTLNFTIDILQFGSTYQTGLVFDIDNSPPNYQSVSGKIVSSTDQVPTAPGIFWSTIDAAIYAIDELSTTGTPSPATGQIAGQVACNGKSDGVCDTNNIVVYYGANPTYAAGVCSSLVNDYDDWYLPSICEMGYDTNSDGSGCGLFGNPYMPNIQMNVVGLNPVIPNAPAGTYWSSTENNFAPLLSAWFQNFNTLNANSDQGNGFKQTAYAVRCVRIFNP